MGEGFEDNGICYPEKRMRLTNNSTKSKGFGIGYYIFMILQAIKLLIFYQLLDKLEP